MRYFGKEDIYYTSAGIVVVSAAIVLFLLLSTLGLVGWIANFLLIVGLGMILGQAIQTWHIDYKFEQELDEFEDILRDTFEAKTKGPLQ